MALMRLVDRVLAAIYRALQDAERRESQRKIKWAVSVHDLGYQMYGAPPIPPDWQNPNVDIRKGRRA